MPFWLAEASCRRDGDRIFPRPSLCPAAWIPKSTTLPGLLTTTCLCGDCGGESSSSLIAFGSTSFGGVPTGEWSGEDDGEISIGFGDAGAGGEAFASAAGPFLF